MKRFEFPLERVLAWRTTEAGREQARLDALAAEKKAIEAAMQQVADQATASHRELVTAARPVSAGELGAVDRFRQFAAESRKGFLAKIAAKDHQIAQQQLVVMEARRKQKLIEKLREKRLREWRIGMDRELAELAEDSYAARRARDRRNSGGRQAEAGAAGQDQFSLADGDATHRVI
ncbi:MAG: hypothetical protein FJW40_10175 [Acidobacteria bacterium]|nr:hypothetical protein [Acidobacteriota bacterium]